MGADRTAGAAIRYDRERLVDVLVHHWPNKNNGCSCGWSVLGASFPEHVADVYEIVVVWTDKGDFWTIRPLRRRLLGWFR